MSDQTIRYVAPRHIVIDGNPTPVPFWMPDQSFLGLPVAIIGGGPSLAALDLEVLNGTRFIAVNSSCRKVRDVATAEDLLFFHDNSWAEHHDDLIRDWPGRVVTSNRNTKARLGDLVSRVSMPGLMQALEAIPDSVGASSGHTAACLAAVMGAKRIVLVGFECQPVEGRTHGHSDYQQHDLPAFWERFLPGWQSLAPVFLRYGVEVVNATPNSAITEFPFVEFREALKL